MRAMPISPAPFMPREFSQMFSTIIGMHADNDYCVLAKYRHGKNAAYFGADKANASWLKPPADYQPHISGFH